MTVVFAALSAVRGHLPRSFDNAHRAWSEREGLLVRLRDDRGHEGQGEASPLPGYCSDDLAETRAALERADWSRVRDDERDVLGAFRSVGTMFPEALRAARFAAETACLDLLSVRRRQPAWRVLGDAAGLRAAPPSIRLAALVDGADAAARAVARGIRTIKLKLGRRPFERELAELEALRAALGPDVELRLDPNRAWTPAEADARLIALAPLGVELVEEPCREIALLQNSARVPLALDESLQSSESALAPAAVERGLAAVVLKPTALGGLARSLALAERARALGLHVVLSHAFEGPVALAAAAALALAAGSPERAAGLDAHPGLAAWPAARVHALGSNALVATDAPGLGVEWTERAP
jgi:L-Ala-D/L-Glu epimerase / N-acetyl-D-glutamate racemase